MLEWLENHLFKCSAFFFLFYFWLRWVFIAVCGLSLVAVQGGGLLFVAVHRLLIVVASLAAEHGL